MALPHVCCGLSTVLFVFKKGDTAAPSVPLRRSCATGFDRRMAGDCRKETLDRLLDTLFSN